MGNIISYGFKNGEDSVKKLLEAALEEHENQRNIYETKLSEVKMVPMKLKPFPNKSFYGSGKFDIGDAPSKAFNTMIKSVEIIDKRMGEIEKLVDKYIDDCEKVYEYNKEVIRHNLLIQKKVSLFMEEIGIPSSFTHSYYKTSRSSRMTEESRKAGYLEDLGRLMETSQISVPNRDSLLRYFRDKYNTVRKECVDKEREQQEEMNKKKDIHKIALLRAKYTPDNACSSNSEIKDAILMRDKYLSLAYSLEISRCTHDQSHAEEGLNKFEVDEGSANDKEIYEDIRKCIDCSAYGHDGRIFRDCKWNYDVLYGMVKDATLLKDLEEANFRKLKNTD